MLAREAPEWPEMAIRVNLYPGKEARAFGARLAHRPEGAGLPSGRPYIEKVAEGQVMPITE